MKIFTRSFFIPQMIILQFFLFTNTSFAWKGHEYITFHSLKDLNVFEDIVLETPYTYENIDQSKYNPEFEVQFLHHEINKLRAFDVIVDYSSEPDWNLDSDIQLNRFQIITGGSQGWRHQRYAMAKGLIHFGVAPKRIAHFYNLAMYSRSIADNYWAVRFLSRAIHYLQDMGQPVHALPMPTRYFLTKHRLNIGEATIVGKNVHLNVEKYIYWRFNQNYKIFIEAMAGREYERIIDVKKSGEVLNKKSRLLGTKIYDTAIAIWPELKQTVEVNIDFDNYPPMDETKLAKLDDIIVESLKNTSQYTRGLIMKFLFQ